MPLCSPVTQRIAAFEVALSQVRELLQEYGKSGRAEMVVRIQNTLAKLREDRETFIQGEYLRAVKQIIERWMPSLTDHEQRPYPFQPDRTGRIVWRKEIFEGEFNRYFPHLIRTLDGVLDISHTGIEELDFLEEVSGDFSANHLVRSVKGLKRVGGALIAYRANPRTTFPALEEVEKWVELPLDLENFLESFPSLRRVGHGIGPDSFTIRYTKARKYEHEALLKQIENLRVSGTLHFTGKFMVMEF